MQQSRSVLISIQYIVEREGKTLLPHYMGALPCIVCVCCESSRLAGLYRLTISDKETYVVVMRNVLSCSLQMTEVYDLKACTSLLLPPPTIRPQGSTFERNADEKELEKDTPTLKVRLGS